VVAVAGGRSTDLMIVALDTDRLTVTDPRHQDGRP
jgi:hypothetical protein